MDLLIIILLIVAAVVLFLVELFLIPGVSIAGILGICSMLYGIYYAFAEMGMLAGFITTVVSLAVSAFCIVKFMRSKTLEKISLKKDIDSKVDKRAEHSLKVGDRGVTTTRLALIGYADINEHIVEVRSADGFLSENTPVIVARVTDGTVLVKRDNIE